MPQDLGAVLSKDGRCRFRIWAPLHKKVQLHIFAPENRIVPMESKQLGYHTAALEGLRPGARYKYRLDDGKEFSDPVSRYQPEGVHGPSEVVDPDFSWNDDRWFGLPIENYII